MYISSPMKILLLATACMTSLESAKSFSARSSIRSNAHIKTALGYFSEESTWDSAEAAKPLPLSVADDERMTEMKNRLQTVPIVLLDSLLPGQEITFSSPAKQFQEILKYVLVSKTKEVGIVGFHPFNGTPLSKGVTAQVDPYQLGFGMNDESQQLIATSLKGDRCFEVIGNPWMDESGSFYLANVEITENRKEILSEEMKCKAEALHQKIPAKVEQFVSWMEKREQLNRHDLKKLLDEIGPLPESMKQRSMWVGALLNPMPLMPEVCPEIRPALLSCRNDHDRMILASTALQSSIDRLSGRH